MSKYTKYIQNILILKLLHKLDYYWKESEFHNKLVEKNIKF